MPESIPIIVQARDRFSTTALGLRTLFETTPGAGDLHPVHCVIGGAPAHLRAEWEREFGDRVHFDFADEFLNQATARNRAMAALDSRLVVVIDNDCYPRPGWLEALTECQADTGATMVVPIILEEPDVIHTAGNRLYVNEVGGKRMGHMVLRFSKLPYDDGSNLARCPIDYGEYHLMLVEREPALRLGAFDPVMQDVAGVDSGLTWKAAGLEQWFEPRAVAYFDLFGPVTVDDIDFYLWRWDNELVWRGYRHFEEKWGFDMTGQGSFEHFVIDYRSHVPLLARRFRSPHVLRLGQATWRAVDFAVRLPVRVRHRIRTWIDGGGRYAVVPRGQPTPGRLRRR